MPETEPTEETDAFIQAMNEKHWFKPDDTLTLDRSDTHIGQALYRWTTETYVAKVQLDYAVDDPDIVLGDVQINDGFVYLYQSDAFTPPDK